MDTPTLIATILTSSTFGGGFTVWLNYRSKVKSGKVAEERHRAADLVTQRDDAYALVEQERKRATEEQNRADQEARNRNRAQDYAALLRRHLIELGGTPPPAPTYERLDAHD